MNRKNKVKKKKNSGRSYSDDRSDRGNLYFLLCSF